MNNLREKVIQLSKGEFNYSRPDIVLSEDNIVLHIEEGNNYHGSFIISNSDEVEMKGVVYSSDAFFTFEDNCFIGTNNEILYEICGEEFSLGDTIHTKIEIVCDCGEIAIPVNIIITDPYCNTSLGNSKDLFHLTSLAKEYWQEALILFQSPDFPRVFLHNNMNHRILYDNLVKSANAGCALEEFLMGVNKKLPISIKVEKTQYEYIVNDDEPFIEKIIIEKDNWGHLDLFVSTESSFLQIKHKRIATDNFMGNTYQLEFIIDSKKLRTGNNYGIISIRTYKETIDAYITCRYKVGIREANNSTRRYQESINDLTKSYLGFRTGETKLAQYIQQVEPILIRLYMEKSQTIYALFLIYVYWNSNLQDKAREELELLRQTMDEWVESSALLYCAFRYLEAYMSGEDEIIEAAIADITLRYDNGHRDWRILWFLLYLDKRYEENILLKLALIREQVLSGIHSPILYHEALGIYQKEPALLHEMGFFEIQIINYGMKYGQVHKELALQYVFLASKEKEYHPIIYKNLVKLYNIYGTKEILTAICSMLIKGQKFGPEYYSWYTLGIQAQLKITQLPESYMYSIEDDKNMILPTPIHQYFIYNSNLSDSRKAYLYGSIIKQKANNSSLYRTYLKQIENFARKQIALKRISSNLAVIYNDIFTRDTITPEIGQSMASILFTHEIRCKNDRIKGVSIAHKELVKDTYIPFSDGKAYINLFTENYQLILVDKEDNRHVSSTEYTLDKLLDSSQYVDICYNYCPDDPMILMHLSEKLRIYHKFNKDIASIGEKIIKIPYLKDEYYKTQLMALLEYYYDNVKGDQLEVYLNTMEFDSFSAQDKNKIMEYSLNHGMFEKSYYFIRKYGYNGRNMKKIAKLCSKLIKGELGISNLNILELDSQEKEFFIQLTFQAFLDGRYNVTLLEYLALHYNGSTNNMYQLWNIAKEHDINTVELEERLLGQILFAESYIEDAFGVFFSYYENGNNTRLINGFLSYYSYRYLAHGRIINPKIFDVIQKELVVEEIKVCLLALLKYYSTKDELTKDETKFIQHYIDGLIQEGFVLPFFKEFKKKIVMPRYIFERTYIEYIADPEHKVTLFYRKNHDDTEEYIEETMTNVYLGIHVKEFTLFYNDELQYYITEEAKGEQIITKSVPLKADYIIEESITSFNTINLMLMARELKDDKTLEDTMKRYMKNKILTKQLFHIK